MEVVQVCLFFTDFWQQDPVVNNDTLAKNLEVEYLILGKTASSQPLGHPDDGSDKAVFY